jgi:hypothetical protein
VNSAPSEAPATAPRRPRLTAEQQARARHTARRRAAAAAARRRRRILGSLLIAVAATGAAAYLSYAPLWSVAVPASLTVAYLVLCRVLVRRERGVASAAPVAEAPAAKAPAKGGPTATGRAVVAAARREARAEATRAPARPAAPEVAAVVASQAGARDVVHRNEQGLAFVTPTEPTISIPQEALADVANGTSAGSLWDPLPMTLPTYVGKARATRGVRTIDLRDPRVANSGRDAADSRLVAESSRAEEEARRAAGG